VEAVASNAGVVVTRLADRDLEKVSSFVHRTTLRCGGYIVHDSRAEAEAAMTAATRASYLPPPADFTIDEQTLVGQLLPELDQANILATFTHLSTAYNNRYYLNTSGEQSALWIRDQWQAMAAGRSDVTVTTYSHAGYVQPSVILTIDGATLPDEVVVLGAHLDSIQGGADNTDPATLAPGADDDGSGIATLTEVVRVLMANGFAPDRTVKFMGYAAEEVGLRGSGDIAADHAAAGTNVVAVMQLDMTDYNGSVEDIALIDDYTNATLTSFIIDLIETYQPTLSWTYTTCGYACSDHASWTAEGFPSAFPFEARFGQYNPTIHTTGDTVATLGNSAAHALKFAQTALAFTVETALAPTCNGNGTCDPGEDCDGCPSDCPSFPLSSATCGNGLCEAGDGEDCVSCAADCAGQQSGKPSARFCCGFGGDGPVGCSDSACTSGGFSCTEIPQGSGGNSCCGDLTCEGSEDGFNCAVDCGAPVCGDAVCDPGEDECNCAADCGLPAVDEFGLCTDGADNDCDTDVDCDDADCAGDAACICGAKGDACSTGADCCSGSCKGNGTCR
jgi:leucyl aminopeptidase